MIYSIPSVFLDGDGRVDKRACGAGDRGDPENPVSSYKLTYQKFGLFVLLKHAQGKPRNRFLVNSLNPPCKKGRRLTHFLHFLAISSMTYSYQNPSVLCTPPLKNHPSKPHRFSVLPPLRNHPSKPVGFVYSPLWKITVFGGRLFRVGAYFGKCGTYSVYCIMNN